MVSAVYGSTAHLNGIERLLFNGVNNLEVKDKYILPPDQRPQLSELSLTASIPTVDLTDLEGPDRSGVIDEIRRACEDYGFFQIVNHGVPERLMEDMMNVAREFFEMPVQDRAGLYSEDQKKDVHICTSFNRTKEEVLNWRDCLRLVCQYPLEESVESWPQKPANYRDVAAKYATEVRALVLRLLGAISESLGLDSDYLNRILRKHRQVMTTNYYPACPNPDITYGLPPHSDPNVITVLQQDDVCGLHVLNNGEWVAVEPTTNAFVVNLADQLQVVSNGRYKSVEHRAITNSARARISIPTFYAPSMEAFVAPAAPLIDDEHPPLYRGFTYREYFDVFYSQGLKRKTVLEHFLI